MSNLSRALREKLAAAYTITVPSVACKQVSRQDGTVKYSGGWGTGTASRRF